MKTIILLMLAFLVLNLGACDLEVIDIPVACSTPGEVICNGANEKIYCSMDYEQIKVCDISSNCETECMHELVQVLVDDIQGNL